MISQEYLYEFLVVAKHLSFTKAAKELFLTQSVLSRHIAALESYLGVELLHRNNRYVTITKAGKVLCEHGEEVIHKLSELENLVLGGAFGPAESLTVACMGAFADILFPVYRQFCVRNPDIQLCVIHREPGEMKQCIEHGAADIGILLSSSAALQDNADGKFIIGRVFEDEICSVVSEHHRFAGLSSVDINDLIKYQIETTDDYILSIFSERCDNAGISLRNTSVVQSPSHETLMLNITYRDSVNLNSLRLVQNHSAYKQGVSFQRICGLDCSYGVSSIKMKANQKPALASFEAIIDENFYKQKN